MADMIGYYAEGKAKRESGGSTPRSTIVNAFMDRIAGETFEGLNYLRHECKLRNKKKAHEAVVLEMIKRLSEEINIVD